MSTKIPFGAAVTDFDERKALEEEANNRRWSIDDVEWLERQLREETDKGESTFWRDRRPQLVAAAKRAHQRGDFLLPEEMSRVEFAAHISTELAPGGVAVPGAVRFGADDVFSRPEVNGIVGIISNLQTASANARSTPGAKPVSVEVRQPAMEVLVRADKEGRILGLRTAGGEVVREIRGAGANDAIRRGTVGFRGETPQELKLRALDYIALAQKAIEVRVEVKKMADEYAGLEELDGGQGGRMLRSTRSTIAEFLTELPATVAGLRWFTAWILEGDEVTRLREQLARLDQLLARAG